jgi:hypothetical protein
MHVLYQHITLIQFAAQLTRPRHCQRGVASSRPLGVCIQSLYIALHALNARPLAGSLCWLLDAVSCIVFVLACAMLPCSFA